METTEPGPERDAVDAAIEAAVRKCLSEHSAIGHIPMELRRHVGMAISAGQSSDVVQGVVRAWLAAIEDDSGLTAHEALTEIFHVVEVVRVRAGRAPALAVDPLIALARLQASIFLDTAEMAATHLDGSSRLGVGELGQWAIGLPRWRDRSAIYRTSEFVAVLAPIVEAFDRTPGERRREGLERALTLVESMGLRECGFAVEAPGGDAQEAVAWTRPPKVMAAGEPMRRALLARISLLQQLLRPELVAQLWDPATISSVLSPGKPLVLAAALRATAHRDGAAGVRSLGEALVEWATRTRDHRGWRSLASALQRFSQGIALDPHRDPGALDRQVKYLHALFPKEISAQEI